MNTEAVNAEAVTEYQAPSIESVEFIAAQLAPKSGGGDPKPLTGS